VAASATILVAWADESRYLVKLRELGFPSLTGTTPAYYSAGHRQRAEKLQSAIDDMNAFFEERLDVQKRVVLAVLDAKGWKDVTGGPYGLPTAHSVGLPNVTGVITMPATSDSPAFGLMMARKEAIPPGALEAFLKENNTSFEAVADQFVDLIVFHEVGHYLTDSFGIDPKNHWLDEFLASYWCYAYISQRQPKVKLVFDLLGRPSKARPKNTSLADFESIYGRVDDYGWYQGMFEVRIREIYPELGLRLLSDLRREFPKTGGSYFSDVPLEARMKPEEVLGRVEKIVPGFQQWAAGFGPSSLPNTLK
jgi:hypothetical protein